MPDSNSSAAVVVLEGLGDPLLGREVGGYVIDAPLSEGGMGVVYRAKHPFLGRSFAVKVMRPEFADDRTLSGNFVREAQTLSALRHPHIIDIVGFGDLDAHRQYMVMEFLEGRSLAQELEAEGALGVRRVLELVEPVLSALEAAHSVDVIHRDLKPSNVFLARVSGGGEVVKLLDFGLAKQQPHRLDAVQAAAAQAGMSVIAGTPEYISPEQAQGQPASVRSDLYSFGVMLFEMLTGRTPFDAADGAQRISELMRQHIHQPAPSLEQQGGEPIPEALVQLVEELLRKDPAQRPASAAVVRQRVQRLLRQLQREATQARPNPLLEVAEEPPNARGLRSNRGAIVFLGAVVLGLGAAVALLPSARAPAPVEPALPAPAPVDAVEPVPPPALSAPPAAPPTVRDASEELTPLPKVPPTPVVVRRAAPAAIQVTSFECEPDEAWRAAARAHLQELQQLAAARGASGWARFSALEPRLSKDLEAATDGAQCDAVERRIRQLARELSK